MTFVPYVGRMPEGESCVLAPETFALRCKRNGTRLENTSPSTNGCKGSCGEHMISLWHAVGWWNVGVRKNAGMLELVADRMKMDKNIRGCLMC